MILIYILHKYQYKVYINQINNILFLVMIQRSYRNLLINLSRGFCKDSKNDNFKNKNEENKNRSKDRKDRKLFQNNKQSKTKSYNSSQVQNQNNQQKKSHKQQNQKIGWKSSNNKDKDNNRQNNNGQTKKNKNEQSNKLDREEDRRSNNQKPRRQKKDKQKQQSQVFNLQSQITDQNKLHNKKIRQNFQYLVQINTLQSQLSSLIKQFNQKQNSNKIRLNMQLYVRKNSKKAQQFFKQNILPAKVNSNEGKNAINKIKQSIIKSYIQTQDLKGLIQFTNTLQKHSQSTGESSTIKGNEIINFLQIISQLQQSPMKYLAINNILKLSKLEQKSQAKTRQQTIIKKILQNFCKDTKTSNNIHKLITFQQLLQTITQLKLLPHKIIKSNSLIQILSKLYFNSCDSNQKYQSLFKIISSVKSTILTQDDYLQVFFRKFYAKLQEKQLESTDCLDVPLKVNTQLIRLYQYYLGNKNRQAVVAIVAICLANRYFSIPQHFLKQHRNYFQTYIAKPVINAIKQQYNILKLSKLIQENDTSKLRQTLQNQFMQNKKVLNKLKVLIMDKNYEQAMEIYNKQYFNSASLQKQRLIIKDVLNNFFEKQMKEQMTGKLKFNMRANISQFVEKLNEQYLQESWKKSQDIGYLLEDYYIKQQDANDAQTKQQKRFSFWQKYFETKRAKQINYYQKLNQLDKIKQPNHQPQFQDQFNLNQYLNEQNYPKYRAIADENDKQETQLTLFFYRVEHGINQIKKKDATWIQRIKKYQSDLCEHNLRLLQEFGIKDYDLQIYDINQYQNRVNNFKKFRGVRRFQDIYHRYYKYQNYQQLIEDLNLDKPKDQAALLDQQGQQENQAPGVQKVEATQQGNVQATQTAQVAAQATQSDPSQSSAEQTQQGQQADQNQQTQQTLQAQQSQTLPEVPSSQVPQPQVYHVSTADPKTIILNNENKLSKQFVDILRIRKRQYFERATINAKLEPLPIVNQLIRWGLLNRQPMAIYMAQKLAMTTRQIIPHELAIRVSDLLSHEREIEQQLIKDCKNCLTHIGRINREFIYDSNKKYQHISYKQMFNSSIKNFNKNLLQRLEDLTAYNPNLKDINNQPRENIKKAAKTLLL